LYNNNDSDKNNETVAATIFKEQNFENLN